MSGVQVIRIDDRDPSVTLSGGTWSQGGNGNEYLSTTSRTNQVGATVNVRFTGVCGISFCISKTALTISKFTTQKLSCITLKGTKIAIYGTIDSTALGTSPVSLFSVDGGRATQFVENQIDRSQYQQKFYESADLSPGTHQLVITVSSVPSIRASFTFDFAEYYVSPNVPSTTTSSSTAPMQITTVVIQQSGSSDPAKTTSTSQTSLIDSASASASHLSSMPSSSSASGSLPSLTSTPSSSADVSTNTFSAGNGSSKQDANQVSTSGSKSSSSSTPAIVGAVVGVLGLLCILISLFFILKKRRARKKDEGFGFSENYNGEQSNLNYSPTLSGHFKALTHC